MKLRTKLLYPLAATVLTLLATPVLNAALRIYKLQGNVSVQKASGKTVKAQQRDDVAPTDRLIIPAGGKVEILDSDTRRIYSSTSTGTMTVKALIGGAKADASAVTRKTNAQVLAAVKESAESQGTRFGQTGVSVHETNAAINLPDLPPGMTYLRYLMQLPPESDYDGMSDIVLVRRDVDEKGENFSFAVFNTLHEPLYVNVIDQRPDGKIDLYFDENPVAVPRTQTLIGEYRYVKPDEPAGYIVIASDAPFTLADVERLMRSDGNASQNFYYSLLRI